MTRVAMSPLFGTGFDKEGIPDYLIIFTNWNHSLKLSRNLIPPQDLRLEYNRIKIPEPSNYLNTITRIFFFLVLGSY